MHLSLWFETKFMTASAAAVNASVRKEKKNTSPSPALFRSGKQSPRRRKRSKRMPYSALFPGPAPPERGDYIKWPVPPPGAALPAAGRGRGSAQPLRGRRPAARRGPGTPGGSRTAPRGGRPGACGPTAAQERPRGLGREGAAVSGL